MVKLKVIQIVLVFRTIMVRLVTFTATMAYMPMELVGVRRVILALLVVDQFVNMERWFFCLPIVYIYRSVRIRMFVLVIVMLLVVIGILIFFVMRFAPFAVNLNCWISFLIVNMI
jgi:hypothetical protein